MVIAENEAEEYQLAEQKKQVYLTRVNQLFSNIKHWLKDEARVEQQEIEVTEKFTGTYTVPSLSISTQAGQELAEIKPKGAYVILAEGLVDIEGGFGREHITYMVDGGPYSYRPLPENTTQFFKKPMFKGIKEDAWYWVEDSRLDRANAIDKELLRELITLVSDYEF
jgi:hypothetical protein